MSYQSRQKHTPAQWQQLVEAQAASGQSQVMFCADHGLSKSSFQHWKRRLQSNIPAPPPTKAGSALFAPLTDAPVQPESDTGWAIELDLGDGVCLRLRRGSP